MNSLLPCFIFAIFLSYLHCYSQSNSDKIDVRRFGAQGDGTAYENAALSTIMSKLENKQSTLLFRPGSYRLKSIVFPKHLTLEFERGATLSIDSSHLVVIEGWVNAGYYRIFQGKGNVRFGAGAITEVYADWWGIEYDKASVDNSLSIQQAVNSLGSTGKMGKVVQFAQGSIFVANPIRFFSGVTLRGTGAGGTYGGTRIIPTNMTNRTVFQFDSKANTSWFHHGGIEAMLIEPADTQHRPYAAIAISQMGENAFIRNVAIYSCFNGIVLGDDSAISGDHQYSFQVSASLHFLSLHRNKNAGILIKRSTGFVNINMLSGDENRYILKVDSASESLSITISGLKTETIYPHEHDPAIILTDSYCALSILGGWVTAYGGAKTFIRITGNVGQPRIVLIGLGYTHYSILIQDDIRLNTVPVRVKASVLDPVYYNVSPWIFPSNSR